MSLVNNVNHAFLTGKGTMPAEGENRQNSAWQALMEENIAASTPEMVVQSAQERVQAANAANGSLAAQEVVDARQEFHDYMEKTPEQRMREAILKSMGLTEESLEAMTPEERRAVEAKIMEIIREKMQEAAREQLEKPQDEATV